MTRISGVTRGSDRPRVLRRVAALVIILAACAWQSLAAGEIGLLFRDSACVNDTVIRLGDIARISGGQSGMIAGLQATVIGEAAPAGYRRFVNSDEVVSLLRRTGGRDASITARNTVRASVRTLAREYRIGDFAGQITGYLDSVITWPAGDYAIRINDSTRQFKCLDKPCSITIAGLDDPRPRGTVRLRLTLSQGGKVQTIPFSCLVTVTTPVLVSRQLIANQQIITAGDIEIARRDITHFRFEPLVRPDQVMEKSACRTIMAGMIFCDNLLKQTPVVQKGDRLMVSIASGPISASATVMARESGAVGDRILVQNVNSHKLLRVIIKEAGKAVLPQKETL